MHIGDFTSIWVIFPELTQWENKGHKLHWEGCHDLETVCDYAVKHSHDGREIITNKKQPHKWKRGITFGDFIHAMNSKVKTPSAWFKMVECQCCDGYKWEISSWEDVFGEEARTRKKIDNTLKEFTNEI